MQESLRPDLISSNLNRTHSSSGELNQSGLAWPLPARQVASAAASAAGPFGRQRVSYNDLCFPKTSNYGSMKKKKHHNVGVSTSTGHNFRQQQPSPLASHSTTYY